MNEIKPALTETEWEEWSKGGFHAATGATRNDDGSISIGELRIPPEAFDALGALFLGRRFTREDIRQIHHASDILVKHGVIGVTFLREIADRIEALLPPEAT